MQVIQLEERTPLIFIDIDASSASCAHTILMYGHMDKQPPLTEHWRPGIGPYTPVREGEKLYGRGGADDGKLFTNFNNKINPSPTPISM